MNRRTHFAGLPLRLVLPIAFVGSSCALALLVLAIRWVVIVIAAVLR